jgi:ankyrin repeat protein
MQLCIKNKRYLFELDRKGFKPAIAVLDRKNSQMLKAVQGIEQKYYLPYTVKNPTALMKKIEQFGINFRNEFNQTPLMASAWVGNIDLFKKLLADGADVYALIMNIKRCCILLCQRRVNLKNIINHFLLNFTHY